MKKANAANEAYLTYVSERSLLFEAVVGLYRQVEASRFSGRRINGVYKNSKRLSAITAIPAIMP